MPALLVVVLAMFSLGSRPAALPQGLAADVLFDGELAAQDARRVANAASDRRAGKAGNLATAALVSRTLAGRGFRVERDGFRHAGRRLENVVGRRAGRTRRQVVVLAARDAAKVPDVPGSAADTAALLELSRVFQGRPSSKTLVLASVDGSALGEVGAERLAERLGDPELVDGVLVMSNLGAGKLRGSLIVPWSNDTTRAGIGLQRTVADSIREELAQPVGETGAAGQLSRLSVPLGIGSQGPFLERGFESVRISGSGELPPAGDGGVGELDEDRLGGLGRATLRTLTALDQSGRPEHGPRTYVTAVSQVMPGWVIALLAMALLLPALVAGVDAFARARRRRMPVTPWLRWLAVWVAPFVAAAVAAWLLALAGATPEPPAAPVAPAANPLDAAAVGVMLGVALVAALAFFGARWLVLRQDARLATPEGAGPACVVVLATTVSAALLWLVNPFAALMTVPAAHLWMLAILTDQAPARRVRLAMVGAGLVPPLLVVLHHLLALHLDPLSGAWYLLLLVVGQSLGVAAVLIACVWLGALAATLAIIRARPDPEQPAEAGPGLFGPSAAPLTRA